MSRSAAKPMTDRRLAIAVRGVVQGVGFRPFVYNAARARGLAGWVRNESDVVRIEVQGDGSAVEAFLAVLRADAPPQASVEAIEIRDLDRLDPEPEAFAIHASQGSVAPQPTIPADLATCEACLEEIHAPGLRHAYPFTNCTNCGPRWSIIESLPYDRPRTSMAGFAMCSACAEQYDNPADRRFHAQPIACPRCGPELRLLDSGGGELARREEALAGCVRAVLDGRIVALKGLGGFQLVVDATHADAVERLRRRKHRPDKPLAVMLDSLAAARRCCEVSDEEADVLLSPQRPILLLRRLAGDATVAEAVAPGNPSLGVMLPCTPLHHLLMDQLGRPVVCTSGNLSEEPMATTTAEAISRLGSIADVILSHNRPIVRPVDDSVVQVGSDGPQLLRRARGYAPRPIELGADGPTVLAVGGHLKNTVALRLGTRVVLGAHVGNLDSVESVEVHRRAVRDLAAFFDVVPSRVACDLHPDYASTRRAEALAAEWGVPLVRVQHHHAHMASAIAEHRLAGPVLGLAWDGTGYGTDATVWGGEALFGDATDVTRVAHLRTFALPGGDRAVREPRRSALGALYEIMRERAADRAAEWFTSTELDALMTMLAGAAHSPRTSSMGRLFDAVAALAGLAPVISFEGQAAMALEFAAEPAHRDAYLIPLVGETPAVADWRPLLEAVVVDRRAGVSLGRLRARFHNALAALAVAIARRVGCGQVVLTGGCFQNRLLTRLAREALVESGFRVYTHREVPPGDGGIALGQVLVASMQTRG